jgi:histone-lysine N-methyltransferase SUV39H
MHVGCFTRFLNHSCDPNCVEVPCIFGDAQLEIPYLSFFTHKDIEKGEEIRFCYRGHGTIIEDQRQAAEYRRRAEAKRLEGKTIKTLNQNQHKIDVPCQCGSWNCIGSIWTWEVSDEEDEESSRGE